MKYPLIIAEGWDLIFYDNIKMAELKLETIDVENQIYRGFDSDAYELSIKAINDQVQIKTTPRKNEDELRKILHHYLDYLNVEIPPSIAEDFRSLLNLAIQIQ